jgi:3-dehydroquinate dehydratase
MSIYMAVKAEHVMKAFASSLFAVKIKAFLFVAVNLPDMAAKSNFRK